jgi:UDP-N-acetylglucosamine 4,6-dehydratase
MVFTSTDKACYPVNVYGFTKALAEKIVLTAGQKVVRYGNVMGSRGSFMPNLILSLKTEGKAYLTDKRMTRFWMSVGQAAKLVANPGHHPVTIPLNIKAATLPAFTEAVASFCGVENYEIIETGIRPGEKIHETLQTSSEEGELIRSDDRDLQFDPGSLRQFVIDVMKGDL